MGAVRFLHDGIRSHRPTNAAGAGKGGRSQNCLAVGMTKSVYGAHGQRKAQGEGKLKEIRAVVQQPEGASQSTLGVLTKIHAEHAGGLLATLKRYLRLCAIESCVGGMATELLRPAPPKRQKPFCSRRASDLRMW